MTDKFVTVSNYLDHFHVILADNKRGAMRTNYLVTDSDFKDVYSLKYEMGTLDTKVSIT